MFFFLNTSQGIEGTTVFFVMCVLCSLISHMQLSGQESCFSPMSLKYYSILFLHLSVPPHWWKSNKTLQHNFCADSFLLTKTFIFIHIFFTECTLFFFWMCTVPLLFCQCAGIFSISGTWHHLIKNIDSRAEISGGGRKNSMWEGTVLPKIWEQLGQFICACCTLKAFGFRIKKWKWDES